MMNALSRLGMTFSWNIGQRLTAMVVIFIFTLCAILAFTLTTIKNFQLDAVVVDIAGRQRMMIQRHFNETMMVSHGVQLDLQKTRDVLLNSLEALKNGGAVIVNLYTGERITIPPAPTTQVRDFLDRQRLLLEQFFIKTETLLLDARGHSPSSESFSSLNQIQDELQRNADEVVKWFSIHSRQKILGLLKSGSLIGILVIILSVVLARQVMSASNRLEQEIEKRKKAEDERNKFFSLSQDLFCIAGLDGQFKMLNPAWEVTLGYSIDELHNQPFMKFVHPDDRISTINELEELRKGHPSSHFENRYIGKDGSYIWLLWNATPSPGADLIYATARNITEQKLYEEELALRDRSINSATNGILIADARQPDMPIVYCNEAFEKITGYAKEDVLGQNCRFLQGQDRNQPGLLEIRRALREGIEARAELRNYRKDGTLFWNEFYIAPVKDIRGTVTHFIGVQIDITRRKNRESDLARLTEELARSNAELQQFAYVASHDLQEPLRMVASYTQLLAKRYKGKLDEDADAFIGYAVDGANRMQQLIRDLLEYSRVGSETQAFEKTDCDQVFQHVMSNLSASIQEHQTEMTQDVLPMVQAHPTLLTQVFQNLIGNALKFQGDSRPKIHVGARALTDGWEFSIRDNGIGIAPDQRDRIFTIFQRLHSRSEYPGTGMGLAICKKIVEIHGGKIWVESEPGKGSTFYFTINTPPVR